MIRENWRIVLLVVLVVASSAALFGPLGSGSAADGGDANATSPTNLQYGLELSGGTRIRAPLAGLHATPDIGDADPNQLQRDLAAELNVSLADVAVLNPTQELPNGAVEVRTGNVTRAEFAAALRANDIDVSENQVDLGVTERTRDQTVRVLNSKINEGGLTGGSVTTTQTENGTYVVVEVPNANRSEVIGLIGTPGRVQVVALSPAENGTGFERQPLLDQSDLTVSGVVTRQTPGGGTSYAVGVTVSNDDAAQRFADTMREEGFTSEQNPNGIGNCDYELGEGPQDDSEYCLLTVRDGETVYAASMGDLATIINNGDFVADPSFSIGAPNQSTARQLELDLRAGALPTTLNIDEGTTYYLQPSLAQEFKTFSVVTGAVAVLAVAFVVFLRYREVGVAAPMVLTAAAEVYLLLGFAALVGLALDLSHIAGFIAVIGTGVDDLVIIADEILQGERVTTGRVFQSRFRKAFWVIGAAAATTIIAMSPLAVLSLGDLQGFALVTIVGVLLGVLVTRPAYGNILRNVVLD
ncbi:preprotein translocase subunit SecD [Halosegnis marinus]|uniref:Protein-export membrane protein SecD n=1 Tax=Halosegnis marinus TaxID=3034023 RepID=A0ABD5ZPF7_9EURY|nr:preprotein translocase subunit SecD [Halosegnis sp. DT85]